MQLETDEGIFNIMTVAELRDQLTRLDKGNSRAILSTGDQQYIQTGVYDNGFVIEKREGNEESHFHARYRGGREMLSPSSAPAEKPRWWERLLGLSRQPLVAHHAFTRAEMTDVLEAYLVGASDPEFLEWSTGYAS